MLAWQGYSEWPPQSSLWPLGHLPSGHLPLPRGTLFPEHAAEQIAMEFPMNTWILLLSSCFRDFEYIYMVLVNAKDKAWNAVLIPSLPSSNF